MADLDLEAIRYAVAVEREALEGIWDRDDVRVLWPKVALRLVERVAWLERELADCTRDCQKVNATCEQATDLLLELSQNPQHPLPDFWHRLRCFLDE
jgi:hypothetical protein